MAQRQPVVAVSPAQAAAQLAQLLASNPTLLKAAMHIATLLNNQEHGEVTVFVQAGKPTHFRAAVTGK